MKKYIFLFLPLVFSPLFVFASTTNGIILTQYGWGNNVGWVNFAPTNGNVHITDSAITGYAWDPVYGWLNLSPNNSGVKNDGEGNLSGFAWSQNAGWVDFSNVKINTNGKFTGIASGITYGQLSFDCNLCNVSTDWRKTATKISGSYLPQYGISSQLQKTTFIFSKNLKQGATGIDVKELQKYLNINGYTVAKFGPGSKGNETNNFGPATRAAVLKFQKANKLGADGIFGEKTRNFINESIALSVVPEYSNNQKIRNNLKKGMTNNDVKSLQIYLNNHGYIISEIGPGSKGNETTYFGLKTKNAVILFQKANNLIADGIVGTKTREILK